MLEEEKHHQYFPGKRMECVYFENDWVYTIDIHLVTLGANFGSEKSS